MRRYHYGAAPAAKPVVVRPATTVTGVAASAVNLAAKPVRWGLQTAGSLVKWLGGTLQNVSNKL
jgi:hypothetical protein